MLKLIGRYEVQGRLGDGAMADVYRAYDPSIDRVIAVKVLKGEFRQDREYAMRFLREAKAAGALSHPNIVTIYDVGEVDGYPYIAMELLEGEPLDKVSYRLGQLPADDVIAIALQLADALSYAHAQGVVHRDIKPSNIMLGRDGRSIKILDFGIARTSEAADAARHEHEAVRTQVGQVVGTPRYMSPEQALGQAIDGRSDLFSVGVVLYELLTGRKAFDGAAAATLALQITGEDPPPIGELAPETPRGLLFIVDKLLAKSPDRRFADGAQLAEALRRELKILEASAEADDRSRRLSLQARTALFMAAITAVVLLVGVGVVLDRQYKAMQGMALTSGSAIAAFVANNAALRAADNASLPADQQDWAPVEAFVEAASDDPNLQQMAVVDSQGVIRASSDPRRIGARYAAPKGEAVVQKADGLTVTQTSVGEARGFRFVQPIVYAGRTFGHVDMSMSRAGLDAVAALSCLLMVGLMLTTLAVVAVVSYVVARRTALPLRRLSTAMRDAAAGDFDFRLSHGRKDEFGELFEDFNRLAATVQARLEPSVPAKPGMVAAKRRALRTRNFATPSAEAEVRSLRGPPPGPLEQTRVAPAQQTGLQRLFNARN